MCIIRQMIAFTYAFICPSKARSNTKTGIIWCVALLALLANVFLFIAFAKFVNMMEAEEEPAISVVHIPSTVEILPILPMSAVTSAETPLLETVRLLFQQAVDDPVSFLRRIDEEDPLHTHVEDPDSFACPSSPSQRLDWPSIVNATAAVRFKRNEPGSWIFYQHLRKAGGTGFCDLAKLNMGQQSVPPYFCMPDRKGSLATYPWSQPSHLLHAMRSHGYRIAANEWDVFQSEMYDSLDGAVFATTVRDPVE